MIEPKPDSSVRPERERRDEPPRDVLPAQETLAQKLVATRGKYAVDALLSVLQGKRGKRRS